jgi:hypothetical protein
MPCYLASQGRSTSSTRLMPYSGEPSTHGHNGAVGGGSNGIRTRVLIAFDAIADPVPDQDPRETKHT